MRLPPPPPPPCPPQQDSAAPPPAYGPMHAPEVDLGEPLYPLLPTQDQPCSTARPKLRLDVDLSRRKPVPPVYSRPDTPVTSRYELVTPESIAPPPWMVFEPRSDATEPERHVTIEGGSPLERFPSVSYYPFQPRGLPIAASMAEVEAQTRDHDHSYDDYQDEDAPSAGGGIDLGLDVDFKLFDALQDNLRLPLSSARASSATPPPRPVVLLNASVEAELKKAVRTMLDPSKRKEQSNEGIAPATAPAEAREMREI